MMNGQTMMAEEAAKPINNDYNVHQSRNIPKRRSIKRKFVDWVISGVKEVSDEQNKVSSIGLRENTAMIDNSPYNSIDADKSINFKVIKAHGGIIIETRVSDPYVDKRPKTGLYIIRNDQDLGQEISKIITSEVLRG